MKIKEELISYSIKLTKTQRRNFLRNGGVKWLRSELQKDPFQPDLMGNNQFSSDTYRENTESHQTISTINSIADSDLISIHFLISNAINKINLELSQKNTNYSKIGKYLKSLHNEFKKHKMDNFDC